MHFGTLKALIRDDRRLQVLLVASLLIQVIICLTAVGIYHPDQHFQLIEFSSWQLHDPSAAGQVWEFGMQIRPTFQVYCFSAYTVICSSMGMHDPYTQLLVLRLLFGLLLFALFNWMCLYYFQRDRRVLFFVLLILNFTWILPYTRTLFSSEMLSSFLFFGMIFVFSLADRRGAKGWWWAALTGFVFSLAFYARFQTAFGMAGFVIWMLIVPTERRLVLPMAIGFAFGAAGNTVLDAAFYHHWVFTPWLYYKANIIDGVAAKMGTSSFVVYIGVLAAVVVAPPLSLALLYTGFKEAVTKRLRDPFTLATLLFIIGHCCVAHKEERFLFPILNVLPIIVGWGLPPLITWWWNQKKGKRRLFNGIAGFSIALNLLLLSILLFTPYSQPIHFTSQLKSRFDSKPVTIYTVQRTPFETEHHLPFVFYRQGTPSLNFNRLGPGDSVRLLPANATYLTATFDQIKDHQRFLDSLGYQRIMYSSRLLWGINEFLDAHGANTINDIWVLYRKK